MVAGKLLLVGGLLLLAVTGYQAMSYREHMRLTQQQFEGLPAALLLQLVVAVAVSVLGSLQVSGDFRPIRVADVPKMINTRPHRVDFAVFNSRASILSSLPHVKQAAAAAPQIS